MASAQVGKMYTGGTFGAQGTVTAYAGRAIAQGAVSGVSAELMGGSFSEGFKTGFAASVLKSALDATLQDPKADSNLKGADKDPVYKPDPAKMNPDSATFDKAYYDRAMEVCARRDVCDWTAANTGSAVYASTADQIGQLVAPGGGGGGSENGLLKYAAKYIPGAQAFSNLHDIHMGGLERLMGGGAVYQFINVATIPAYAYAQYQAFGYRSASYQYDLSMRREAS